MVETVKRNSTQVNIFLATKLTGKVLYYEIRAVVFRAVVRDPVMNIYGSCYWVSVVLNIMNTGLKYNEYFGMTFIALGGRGQITVTSRQN